MSAPLSDATIDTGYDTYLRSFALAALGGAQFAIGTGIVESVAFAIGVEDGTARKQGDHSGELRTKQLYRARVRALLGEETGR